MAPRFYVYKCVVDDGGAPCIDRGLWSLSICKPMIRSTARVGDVIFAFGSNFESPANRLIYIAKVTHKLTEGEYYELAKFQRRGDCIYERTRTKRFRLRANAQFHTEALPETMVRDIGTRPNYARANSLVSSDFRYFGAKGSAVWKTRAPALARVIERLGQGHRVKHSESVRAELLALMKWTWRTHDRKVLGRQLHPPEDAAANACSRPRHPVKTTC